jgi:hypothetical protein
MTNYLEQIQKVHYCRYSAGNHIKQNTSEELRKPTACQTPQNTATPLSSLQQYVRVNRQARPADMACTYVCEWLIMICVYKTSHKSHNKDCRMVKSK